MPGRNVPRKINSRLSRIASPRSNDYHNFTVEYVVEWLYNSLSLPLSLSTRERSSTLRSRTGITLSFNGDSDITAFSFVRHLNRNAVCCLCGVLIEYLVPPTYVPFINLTLLSPLRPEFSTRARQLLYGNRLKYFH